MALKIMSYNNYYDKETFLDACARVYDQYLGNPSRESHSLIRASQEFFSDKNSESLTYDKGFLVSFLMDLELFFSGNGLRSPDDFFKCLFRKYIEEEAECSGQKITEDIDSISVLKKIADKYVRKAEAETGKISFTEYGLEFRVGSKKFAPSQESPRPVKDKIGNFLTFAK